MCGIAGAIRPVGQAIAPASATALLTALAHRGPDDEGMWSEGGVWLGHRRLAIVDLSPAGRQPMVSACGRYVFVLNGEIYNHPALRREVEAAGAADWRGRSDAEVFLEVIARFGLDRALEKARGMFAFALWDRERRTLRLVRDRFGEKPLYYADGHDSLTFASELRALERLPGLTGGLSADALSLYFRYGYIPAPLSAYENVRKLHPGCILTWREGDEPTVTPYWRLGDIVEAGHADRLNDPAAAVEALDRLLRQVIECQMLADVPLGAFLSGGIDSSLVVAIMQAVAARPVKTFTMGFESAAFNEAEFAAAVARRLGTDHTEHTVTDADARAVVPRLGAIFDEPFADASQIPTFLISRMARRHVTVALTGDGGDEMFGGYVRYPGVPRLWKALARMPLRRAAAAALAMAPMRLVEGSLGFLAPVAARYASRGKLGPSLRRAAGWAAAGDIDELYELTMTAWPDPERLLVSPPRASPSWRPARPPFDNGLEAMMWRDSIDYLPGDILCKVDRAAMANGLETRAPLLDPRIAAFAWRAPPSMKLAGGETKWLLRRVLDRYVPRELIDRPKMGFSVPLHDWLTGPLRGWAEDLLDPALIARQGVLNPQPAATVWKRYLSGDTSVEHQVWTVLMFQSWQAARGTLS
ncbi:MAG: asparagine synthase (glutamine-hydrolyzing) [Caulobacteraceae bacterium]